MKGNCNVFGTCALKDIVRSSQAEVTYKLLPHHRMQGLMTEALREVLRFSFEEICLHRVQAKVMQHNTNSVNVLKKLNFQEEGLLREYAFGNTFADVVMFSMLKTFRRSKETRDRALF